MASSILAIEFRDCDTAGRAYAPSARISSETQIASMISCSLAPQRWARRVSPRLHCGRWIVYATATAISCLAFSGSAP